MSWYSNKTVIWSKCYQTAGLYFRPHILCRLFVAITVSFASSAFSQWIRTIARFQIFSVWVEIAVISWELNLIGIFFEKYRHSYQKNILEEKILSIFNLIGGNRSPSVVRLIDLIHSIRCDQNTIGILLWNFMLVNFWNDNFISPSTDSFPQLPFDSMGMFHCLKRNC